MTTFTGSRNSPFAVSKNSTKLQLEGLDFSGVLCAVVFLATDFLAVAAAGVIVSRFLDLLWPSLQPIGNGAGPAMWRIMVAVFFIPILLFTAKGRYSRRIPFWAEVGLVVVACLYAAIAAVMFGVLSQDAAVSVAGVAAVPVFGALAIAGNLMAKMLVFRTSHWAFPVLVIGHGSLAAAARSALESDCSLGYRCVGQIDPEVAAVDFGEAAPLRTILRRFQARGLLIAVDSEYGLQDRLVAQALRERIPFHLAPQPRTSPVHGWEPLHLFGHHATIVSIANHRSIFKTRSAKTAIDVIVAAVLLVVAAPLLLLLSILSRLDGGPAFYAHRRIGVGGRPFRCLKFRTMVVDAEKVLAAHLAANAAAAAEWEATRKLTDDPRVTPIGRFLRKTSLDELPQLFNVLRLEMSLVGPRPIVEAEVPFYGKDISHYYATKPGLTGMWQVSGRSDTSYARRVELDVWYVTNRTIWHDIVLLLKTIPAVVGGQGAR